MRSPIAATAVAVSLSVSLFSAPLHAATADDPLDEVVVTATRSATLESRVAIPVIVIDRAQIDASLADDVASLFAGQAGMEIGRTGGPGQSASLFLRGTDSNHALVLVDGVAINPGTIGGAALQNIAPENIERIEVVKGPRAALYGTSAIGGVVNIITRADAANGIAASVGGGSWDTRTASASVGAQASDDLHLGVGVSWRDVGGFPPYRGVHTDSGYENLGLNGSVRYAASDTLTLIAHGWRTSGNTEYYDSFVFAPRDFDYRTDSYSAGAQWNSGSSSAHAIASRSENLQQQNQSSDFDKTRRNALDLGAGWRVPVLQDVSVGALLSHEQTDSLSYGTGYDRSTDVWQLYAQDQLQLARSSLLFALGHTHHQTFGSHTTWNAELVQPVGTGISLSAAAGTAFRAPDGSDRFGYGGTPDLKPEKSQQIELGVRARIAANQLLTVNGFQNNIDDLIDYDPINYTAQNIASAHIRGVEVQYQLRLGAWHADTQFTAQHAYDPDSNTDLLRRARRYGSLGVGRDGERLGWNVGWQVSGARPDYGYPTNVRLGGYGLVNLSAAWKIAPEWTLRLAVDNAFDHDYELASGYDTGGRSVNVALRYTSR